MSFPRYPKYKSNGVKWLGEVPEEWEVLPVRAVTEHIDLRNEGATCEDYLSLMANVGVIPYADKGDIGNKKPEDLSKCKLVEVGDIVINSMNYNIGSYGISPYGGVCSPVYVVLRINEQIARRRFAFRIFQNTAFQKYAASFGNGILAHRAAIGWEELKVIPVAVPSRSEQQTILDFLDEETAKIDALIGEQRRLIELLKEKRQAVISHAITKGFDLSASLKSSGSDAFDYVPKHWQFRSVRAIARVGNGSTPSRENLEYWQDGDIPWLTSTVVNQSEVFEAEEFVTAKALKDCHLPIIPPDSILIGITGQGRTRGMATLLRFRATINQHIAYVVPRDGTTNVAYLRRVFETLYEKMRSDSDGAGSTKGAITCEQIQKLRLPLPPRDEQDAILRKLEDQLLHFRLLTLEANRAIHLLQERRSALISAAVTGKIDVRNYKPQPSAVAEGMYEPA